MVGVTGFSLGLKNSPPDCFLRAAARRPVQTLVPLATKKTPSLSWRSFWSEWRDLNPRPLGPEPSALPTALHPGKKNRSSQAAAVWLGMRGSNSHGRSQSPLHYHYANPHRILCLGRLPSTLIYYSVPRRICQRFFQKNFKIFKKSLSALHSLFLCFHGHLPANGLYCFS